MILRAWMVAFEKWR